MARIIRIVTTIALAVWTLLLWGAHALVSVGGDAAYRNADRISDDPNTVETLAWALNLTQDVGLIAIIIVWGLGALVMAVVGYGIAQVISRRNPSLPTYR